jgi:hypothetical protein
MAIIACTRCLKQGDAGCADPTKVPSDRCVLFQLDWTLEEKLKLLRERGVPFPESTLASIHAECERERLRREENERRCIELMRGAPEPQDTILRLSGLGRKGGGISTEPSRATDEASGEPAPPPKKSEV